jgi:HPt (histidine-containing phosphotransfer) domain-containing protein
MHQTAAAHERICAAAADERRKLAHGLRGAALGIGAQALAEAAAAVEADPGSRAFVRTLSRRIEEVREFIAAISR